MAVRRSRGVCDRPWATGPWFRVLLLLGVCAAGVGAGCAQRRSCFECVSDYGCAWCSAGAAAGGGGKCHSTWETTDTKPSRTGEQSCTMWHFANSSLCPVKTCSQLTTCKECLSAPLKWSSGFAGCGWCDFTQKCMDGVLTSSVEEDLTLPTGLSVCMGMRTCAHLPVVVETIASVSVPHTIPRLPGQVLAGFQCQGAGNWTFGTGRCACYDECDTCTENDCGWCESTRLCLKPSPHAGAAGPSPYFPYEVPDEDGRVSTYALLTDIVTVGSSQARRAAAAKRAEQNAVRHRWHNFRNGPGIAASDPLYVNQELALCPEWHWRSCPCRFCAAYVCIFQRSIRVHIHVYTYSCSYVFM